MRHAHVSMRVKHRVLESTSLSAYFIVLGEEVAKARQGLDLGRCRNKSA
jgi:hypothetical protein